MKPKTDSEPGADTIRASPTDASPPEAMPEETIVPSLKSRWAALASLLADDSPSVLAEVHRALEAAGQQAIPALERAARSDDPRIRTRARAFLVGRAQRTALRRISRYASRPEVDLERGLFLLARFHVPNLDPRPYRRALDAMAAELARRMARVRGELERALLLPEYLGKELRFAGSRGEFHHPDNIHFHRAIERRAGIPLTLSAIWLAVARRAGIRAGIIPLPGHVLLRIYGGWKSAIVDPYHCGRRRSESECKRYALRHGVRGDDASLRDAPDAHLLRRQIGNLGKSADLRRLPREQHAWSSLLRGLDGGGNGVLPG